MAGAPLGNQNGKKAKLWEQAIKRALARYSGESVDRGLDLLADKLVKAAMDDDSMAQYQIIEQIGNRIDGKPAQAIVGDDESDPVSIRVVERVIVRPNTTNSDG